MFPRLEKMAERVADGEGFGVDGVLGLVVVIAVEETFDGEHVPFATKGSDFTSDVVEGGVTPAPRGGVGTNEPKRARRELDMARRVAHGNGSPFFESRQSGGPDDTRCVPEIFTFLEEA